MLTDELRAEIGDLAFGGDTLRPGLFETFHTDDTYTERPALATVLVRPGAAERARRRHLFLDMRAAYRSLDVATRAGSNAGAPRTPTTTATRSRRACRRRARSRRSSTSSHPIVRAHPMTGGPSLYVDLDRATHVEDVPVAEGRALLQRLQDHAESDAPRYAHRWQPHDVLIWDNASVQHKASGDFPVGEPRNFWRYMIEGPIPAEYVTT